MPHMSGLSMWLIVALVILGWPLVFVVLWSGIVMLMSLLGGWRRLAGRYRAVERPSGSRSIPFVTGMVGISRYKRLLSITSNERGMFVEIRWIFRIGHPTLFIPWSDIHNARKINLFYWEFIAFDIGNRKIASMRLPSQVFDGTPVFIN
jgi:hypothetical protein